jgi:hypothetical protein
MRMADLHKLYRFDKDIENDTMFYVKMMDVRLPNWSCHQPISVLDMQSVNQAIYQQCSVSSSQH